MWFHCYCNLKFPLTYSITRKVKSISLQVFRQNFFFFYKYLLSSPPPSIKKLYTFLILIYCHGNWKSKCWIKLFSQPGIICTMLRNTFWWHFLLMLGIHVRNVLWDITNCARIDSTSKSSDQGHSEVKGQIGAFWSWKSVFYHLCNKIQVNLDFLIQLTTIIYSD